MQWCHWFALDLFVCRLIPSKHSKRSDTRYIPHIPRSTPPLLFALRILSACTCHFVSLVLFALVPPVLLLFVPSASA